VINHSSSLKELIKTSCDSLFPVSRFLVFDNVCLVFENNRSEGTEVEIILNFCRAISYKFGYIVFMKSHTFNGSVSMDATGFAK